MMLQALREYQSDTFDDWRDLLEEQERRTRDELDASKVLYKLLVLLSNNTGLMLSVMLRSCSAASYCAAYGFERLAYTLYYTHFEAAVTTEHAATRTVTFSIIVQKDVTGLSLSMPHVAAGCSSTC